MTLTYSKYSSTGAYAHRVMDTHNSPLRAVIFDFDGVLFDSEPLHFSALQKVLAPFGGDTITEELYKDKYIALDDQRSLEKYFQEANQPLSAELLGSLMEDKTKIYQELVNSEGLLPYPAVPEFVMSLAQRYPLAIASGARRHEVELVLESAGLRSYFEVLVAADDVQHSKPHPESYLKAMALLNESGKRNTPICPEECVVIEDSVPCITGAHQAGMKCVAVANTFPVFELKNADLVVPSLSALRVTQLEDLFQAHAPLLPTSPAQNN